MPPFARASEVLAALAAAPGERLTVAEIVAVLRGRAFALLVLLLGLPNCLPMPPPIPTLSGLLLALVAAQIIAGRATPWLPRALLARSIDRAVVRRAALRVAPVLTRIERYSRPRLAALSTAPVMRIMGFLLLALALALLVAAPVVGQIPLGLAVSLVGLGLVERDGVVVLAGFAMGLVGLALNVGFVVAVVAGVIALLSSASL